jgi:hypothetical protein
VAVGEQLGHEGSCLEQVLEVVEHEEHAPLAQMADEPLPVRAPSGVTQTEGWATVCGTSAGSVTGTSETKCTPP